MRLDLTLSLWRPRLSDPVGIEKKWGKQSNAGGTFFFLEDRIWNKRTTGCGRKNAKKTSEEEGRGGEASGSAYGFT